MRKPVEILLVIVLLFVFVAPAGAAPNSGPTPPGSPSSFSQLKAKQEMAQQVGAGLAQLKAEIKATTARLAKAHALAARQNIENRKAVGKAGNALLGELRGAPLK